MADKSSEAKKHVRKHYMLKTDRNCAILGYCYKLTNPIRLMMPPSILGGLFVSLFFFNLDHQFHLSFLLSNSPFLLDYRGG